jgi:cyclophilin family peptidyl-prolyl cis-trans isomerase
MYTRIGTLICIALLLAACGTPSGQQIQVNEIDAEPRVRVVEVTPLNNCGGVSEFKPIFRRSLEVEIIGHAELGINIKALQARVAREYSAKWKTEVEAPLTVPPGTNVEYTIAWNMEGWRGTLTTAGLSNHAQYVIHGPVNFELVSVKNLGCNIAVAPTAQPDIPTTTPIAQPDTPAAMNQTDNSTAPTKRNNKYSAEPEMVIDQNKKYTATIETTKGTMTAALYAKEAPKTVNNFVFLARDNFYENMKFHRIIKDFMIQTGDPTATGAGGPGYSFEDETIPDNLNYVRGTLAMANSGPNTNGSQFFIVHSDYPLPKQYTIFGQVIEGLDVLDVIANTPTTGSEGSTPTEDLRIKRVIITEQ